FRSESLIAAPPTLELPNVNDMSVESLRPASVTARSLIVTVILGAMAGITHFREFPARGMIPEHNFAMERARVPAGVIAPVRPLPVCRLSAPAGVIAPVNERTTSLSAVNAPVGVMAPVKRLEADLMIDPAGVSDPASALFACLIRFPAGVMAPVKVRRIALIVVRAP